MWQSTSLGEIISLDYGFGLPKAKRKESGGIPVLGSNGVCGHHDQARVSGPGIVVGRKGSAGLVTWVEEDFWPIDTTYYVTPKVDIELKWVYYLLRQLRLDQHKTSTGVPGLNRNDVYGLNVSVPPRSEQRRIVEILDQADALRKQRAEADKKAARILPALFYQMFGDPATNPHRWPLIQIRDLLEPVKRLDPRNEPNKTFIYVDIAGVDGSRGAIVETKEILGVDAPSRARQIILENDVIVSTVRPYLRATALVPEYLHKQICSTGYCVLRARERHGFGFLYGLSRLQWFTDQLNARARGASYPAVTDNDILDLLVPYAESQELHKVYDFHVKELMAMQAIHRQSDSVINRLFDSLLHRAFSGELTNSWREAHMKELLQEMEHQATALTSG